MTSESELEPRNFRTRSSDYLSAMLGVGRLVEMTFIATYCAVKGEPKEGDVNCCLKLT